MGMEGGGLGGWVEVGVRGGNRGESGECCKVSPNTAFTYKKGRSLRILCNVSGV